MLRLIKSLPSNCLNALFNQLNSRTWQKFWLRIDLGHSEAAAELGDPIGAGTRTWVLLDPNIQLDLPLWVGTGSVIDSLSKVTFQIKSLWLETFVGLLLFCFFMNQSQTGFIISCETEGSVTGKQPLNVTADWAGNTAGLGLSLKLILVV